MMSMGAILPAIGLLGGEGVASDSQLNKMVLAIVNFVGISPTLTNFILLVAALLTMKSLIALSAMTYVAASVAAVQAQVRRRMLSGVMQARWGYFVELPPGQIANAIAGQSLHAGEAYYSTSMVIVSSDTCTCPTAGCDTCFRLHGGSYSHCSDNYIDSAL